jgi:hypothetical protein
MRSISLCTFVILVWSATALAGGYYFQKPDMATVPDNARVLVYDANTDTDKNWTGAFLKQYFSGAAPVQSVAGKIGAVSLAPEDLGLATTCTGRVSWDGMDGSMIYTGSTVPAADLGLERDIYVRTNGDLYHKEGSPAAWVWKASLTGPPNTLTVGTVTTGTPGTPASVVIRGAAPDQLIDMVIPKGDPGDPGTISRDQMTTTLDNPSNTIVYLQPATNSPTAGGLVINDYFGGAAIIIRNGGVEVRDTGGITIAKIDRGAGSIASYDTAGNMVAKMDRTGFYTLKSNGSAGITWTRTGDALVIQ